MDSAYSEALRLAVAEGCVTADTSSSVESDDSGSTHIKVTTL